MVDVLGGLGHVDFLLVVEVGEEVGEGAAVVEVGVRDDDHGELLGVELVEEGEGLFAALVDHEAAVEHDLLVVDGEDDAGAADLAAGAEG